LSVAVYHLPTKENNFRFPFLFAANTKWQLAVSVSIFSKQTEVAIFR
jgi:hypothetical protein